MKTSSSWISSSRCLILGVLKAARRCCTAQLRVTEARWSPSACLSGGTALRPLQHALKHVEYRCDQHCATALFQGSRAMERTLSSTLVFKSAIEYST